MTAPITTLRFVNPDAEPKTRIFFVAPESIEHVIFWYGSHHAGDRYDVYLDGQKIKHGQNGEYLPC
jgi:hypothetical protein